MASVLVFESKDATETYTPSSICITHRLGMLHLTIETTVTPYTRHVTRVLNFSLPEGYKEVSFKAWTYSFTSSAFFQILTASYLKIDQDHKYLTITDLRRYSYYTSSISMVIISFKTHTCDHDSTVECNEVRASCASVIEILSRACTPCSSHHITPK